MIVTKMRIVRRKIGQKLDDRKRHIINDYRDVLQCREWICRPGKDRSTGHWSEWQDVPIVDEED